MSSAFGYMDYGHLNSFFKCSILAKIICELLKLTDLIMFSVFENFSTLCQLDLNTVLHM